MQLYGYDATPEMKRDFDAINEHHLRKFGFLPEGRETLSRALALLAHQCREETRDEGWCLSKPVFRLGD